MAETDLGERDLGPPGGDRSDPAASQSLDSPTLLVDEAVRRLASVGGSWLGVRPGSNFSALLELKTPLGAVDGEMLEALHREGIVKASHEGAATGQHVLTGGRISESEAIPDVEMDWRWRLSDGVRRPLAASCATGGSITSGMDPNPLEPGPGIER